MIELIELLLWIDSIVSLNIETMTPAEEGSLRRDLRLAGLVFRGGRRVPLFDDEPRSP